MRRFWIGSLFVSGILLGSLAATSAGQDAPRRSGLVEETGRRLVLLDVTVRGPRDVISELGREDFELIVKSEPVESFRVDNLCTPTEVIEPVVVAEPSEQPVAVPAPAVAPRARANYLFYFDQNNLTVEGRLRAVDMTRDLIEELIGEGDRGLIVSNGRDLKTYAELTDDREALLAAVERMGNDTAHWWDPTRQTEESRVTQLVEKIYEDPTGAQGMARLFAQEERWRTEKALNLFSLVLARMADLDPPRSVIYFSDNVRANAGEHYLSYFGARGRKFDDRQPSALTAAHAFQGVLEQANALGIRLYTVQARGLIAETNDARFSRRAPGAAASTGGVMSNSQRIRHAQDSLVGMAQESGGQPFLNGVKATRIAREIRDDLSCLYLLSFDPVGLQQDRPIPVVVRSTRAKVKTQVRGRFIVQSQSKRLTSRLLAAFATPDGVQSEFPLKGTVIPTGFEKGKYTALVQLVVPGSPLPSTSWDLGLSMISEGEVREDASGHVNVRGAGMPVIFETQMSFAPGPYEVVAVVHETQGDQIGTTRIEGSWPDPDDAPATVGLIAVVQPDAGAFLRDTDIRRSGSVGLTTAALARPDRPTALVGIVCRGDKGKRQMQVERRLIGEDAVEFPAQELDTGDGRCALFSDLIRAGTMSAGSFRYEVRVVDDDEELATGTREFFADDAPATTGS